MNSATRKRRGKRRRKEIEPQKLKQRRQKAQTRTFFKRLGFQRHAIDGVEFTFQGRTGELDDAFIYENIIVLAEYTVGQATSAHALKKKVLFDKIYGSPSVWVREFEAIKPGLIGLLDKKGYAAQDVRLRIIYVADTVADEAVSNSPDVHFLDGTRQRYFRALSKTIHRSARHELFKFLGIEFSEIGEQIHTSASQQRTFNGHILPEGHSSFPPGFKVVSFYADPDTLLSLSYVLRQDSWRDSEALYQRILIPSKIRKMRKYLVDVKRVFVNNIIVTLPASVSLNDPRAQGKNIDSKAIERVAPVSIQIPFASNAIGLVDGQHRVFCYYEGDDKVEPKIAQLRKRQNLLVTGLIFPTSWSSEQKRRFEAQLFLEINDTQARAKSGLKQSIEVVLNPLSTTAIAKEITNQLSRRGALKDLLQVSVFDPPGRIKTTSIVSYGLRPLIKFEGNDTLFAHWSNANKEQLKGAKDVTEPGIRDLLNKYVEYCVSSINGYLIGAKLCASQHWKINEEKKVKGQWLSPTTINGLFVCLRLIAQNDGIRDQSYYQRKFTGLDTVKVRAFRSSQWHALGEKLYQDFFQK